MIERARPGALAGVLLVLLGALVLCGWIFRLPSLVRLGHTAMVANTALCFVLLGLALTLTLAGSGPSRALQSGLAATVAAISVAVLVENIFGVSLGIDLRQAHSWLADRNPFPGRMALTSALAFLCASLVLILLPRVSSKARGIGVHVLTSLVLLLGLTGLAGNTLQLNLLYAWLSLTEMALHSALGITLLGLGLWASWRNQEWYASRRFFQEDEKIVFVSVAALIVIALAAGIAGFAGQKASLERGLTQRLPSELRSNITIFNAALERSFAEAYSVAHRPNLLRLTAQLADRPADAALRAELDRIGQSVLASGATGFRIVGLDHAEFSRLGRFVDASGPRFDFARPVPGTLLWDGQLFIEQVLPLHGATGLIGHVHLQQPLVLITRQLMAQEGLGRTGEMGFCFQHPRLADKMQCFPQYRNPRIYEAFKLNKDGNATPMALALAGQHGIFRGLDYRGRNVIGVHAPFSIDGLGLIIKQDAEELLEPISEQIRWTGPLLLVLVISGALLVRTQISPLTSRLVLSERQASERELRIQTLVNSVGEGIITISDAGLILSFNKVAATIFGHAPAAVIGQNIEILMPAALRARHAAGMKRYLGGAPATVVGQGRVVLQGLRSDGAVFPLELTVNKVETDGSRLFVGIVRDITEQQESEAALHLAMQAAQNAASARSIFVANMSHELRTPMNAVLGVAELLARSPLSPDQARDVEMIRTSGRSLLGIINNILDFSKLDAGKVEISSAAFALDDVLRTVATIMSISASDKNIELAIGVDLNVPRQLAGDALRLEQILINLSANAIKFTDAGEVSIQVALVARQDTQARLAFSVRDTGIGISAEQQQRLFSAFTQADASTTRRFGGTGLGLAISKALVELLGGSIEVASQPGAGSTFSFTLPFGVIAANSASKAALGPLRILLADANPTSRACLGKTVLGWKWELDAVPSASQALALLEAPGSAYDLVLADWQLPGGMDAMRATAAQAQTPLIVLISAYGRNQPHQSAHAMLTKPVTASSLFDAVQDALAAQGKTLPGQEAQVASETRIAARILLVEDNLINQFVARSFLEHAGAVVQIASDGQQALDCLGEQAGAFDIVLMDVQMPVMDGVTATRLIRGQLGLSIPIIAMTAGVMDEERERCLGAGMNGFIGKPLDVAQMLEMIREQLAIAAQAGQ